MLFLFMMLSAKYGFSGYNPIVSQRRFALRKCLLINECLREELNSYFYLFFLAARPQKNYLTSWSSSFLILE